MVYLHCIYDVLYGLYSICQYCVFTVLYLHCEYYLFAFCKAVLSPPCFSSAMRRLFSIRFLGLPPVVIAGGGLVRTSAVIHRLIRKICNLSVDESHKGRRCSRSAFFRASRAAREDKTATRCQCAASGLSRDGRFSIQCSPFALPGSTLQAAFAA